MKPDCTHATSHWVMVSFESSRKYSMRYVCLYCHANRTGLFEEIFCALLSQ